MQIYFIYIWISVASDSFQFDNFKCEYAAPSSIKLKDPWTVQTHQTK